MATERSSTVQGKYSLQLSDGVMDLTIWPSLDSEAQRAVDLYTAMSDYEPGEAYTSFIDRYAPRFSISSGKGFEFELPPAIDYNAATIIIIGEREFIHAGHLMFYTFEKFLDRPFAKIQPGLCEYIYYDGVVGIPTTDIAEMAKEAQRLELPSSGSLEDLRGLVNYWVTATTVAGE